MSPLPPSLASSRPPGPTKFAACNLFFFLFSLPLFSPLFCPPSRSPFPLFVAHNIPGLPAPPSLLPFVQSLSFTFPIRFVDATFVLPPCSSVFPGHSLPFSLISPLFHETLPLPLLPDHLLLRTPMHPGLSPSLFSRRFESSLPTSFSNLSPSRIPLRSPLLLSRFRTPPSKFFSPFSFKPSKNTAVQVSPVRTP